MRYYYDNDTPQPFQAVLENNAHTQAGKAPASHTVPRQEELTVPSRQPELIAQNVQNQSGQRNLLPLVAALLLLDII